MNPMVLSKVRPIFSFSPQRLMKEKGNFSTVIIASPTPRRPKGVIDVFLDRANEFYHYRNFSDHNYKHDFSWALLCQCISHRDVGDQAGMIQRGGVIYFLICN